MGPYLSFGKKKKNTMYLLVQQPHEHLCFILVQIELMWLFFPPKSFLNLYIQVGQVTGTSCYSLPFLSYLLTHITALISECIW